MTASFHKGEYGKLSCCLAMGDKDKKASEFRATKWGLQVLNTSKKTRMLRREQKYSLATWKYSKLLPLVAWRFINTRGTREGRSRKVQRSGKKGKMGKLELQKDRELRDSVTNILRHSNVTKVMWQSRTASRAETLLLAALLWESRALPSDTVPYNPEWHFLWLLSPSCLQVKLGWKQLFCFVLAKGGNQDMGREVGFPWTSCQICFGLMLSLTQGREWQNKHMQDKVTVSWFPHVPRHQEFLLESLKGKGNLLATFYWKLLKPYIFSIWF